MFLYSYDHQQRIYFCYGARPPNFTWDEFLPHTARAETRGKFRRDGESQQLIDGVGISFLLHKLILPPKTDPRALPFFSIVRSACLKRIQFLKSCPIVEVYTIYTHSFIPFIYYTHNYFRTRNDIDIKSNLTISNTSFFLYYILHKFCRCHIFHTLHCILSSISIHRSVFSLNFTSSTA
ncbi:hypothetical protein QVD17_20790 [Tagetes erecta]|uniref:Uncharacterized protein n=1 Tax=Tagetes erecta TaxID=13708 RepID=A0AAD8KPU1_TARER|nr:hypothetical protein QVD17_20790 [Tagetes erecta]